MTVTHPVIQYNHHTVTLLSCSLSHTLSYNCHTVTLLSCDHHMTITHYTTHYYPLSCDYHMTITHCTTHYYPLSCDYHMTITHCTTHTTTLSCDYHMTITHCTGIFHNHANRKPSTVRNSHVDRSCFACAVQQRIHKYVSLLAIHVIVTCGDRLRFSLQCVGIYIPLPHTLLHSVM